MKVEELDISIKKVFDYYRKERIIEDEIIEFLKEELKIDEERASSLIEDARHVFILEAGEADFRTLEKRGYKILEIKRIRKDSEGRPYVNTYRYINPAERVARKAMEEEADKEFEERMKTWEKWGWV